MRMAQSARPRVSPTQRKSRIAGLLFFAPYGILLVGFGLVPIGLAMATSLQATRMNPAGGFRNYLDVIQDFRFLPALINVGIFLAIFLPSMIVIVTLMALLLDAYQTRWSLPLRLAYIVPASISGSVAVLVWYFLLEPTLSPYRDVLHALGITQAAQIWNPDNLAWIFALIAFATGAGNWIVIQYGSLQSISEDLVEAARLDGCNAAQIGLLIKLPLIRKYIVYMGVLTFAAGVQVFVEPQLINAGVYTGLAENWSINQVGYTLAFTSGNFAGSAALSLLLFFVCLIAALFLIYRTDFFKNAEDSK